MLLPDIETVHASGRALLVVRVTRWPGLDLEGTVLDALEEAPHFIRCNTRMAARIEGMRRRDIPEYPSIALREALARRWSTRWRTPTTP